MKKIRSGVFAILVSMLMVFVMIPPLEAHASTTVTLKPGDHYNFSEKSNYKKYGAYYVKINKEGEYYLTGSASNTMLLIDAPKDKSVTVYLRGVNLSPDNTAPGSGSHRAAMEILAGSQILQQGRIIISTGKAICLLYARIIPVQNWFSCQTLKVRER